MVNIPKEAAFLLFMPLLRGRFLMITMTEPAQILGKATKKRANTAGVPPAASGAF
jgi:hypothetical protein